MLLEKNNHSSEAVMHLRKRRANCRQKASSQLTPWVPDHLQKKAFSKTQRQTFTSAYRGQDLQTEGKDLPYSRKCITASAAAET